MPKFQEISDGFMVTAYKDHSVVASGKSSEKTSERILSTIMADGMVTAEKIASIMELSSRTVESHIAKLKQEGKLKRVGTRKNGSWEILVK